jgi:hypothetical protein
MVGTSAVKTEVGGSSPVLVLAILLFIYFFLFFSVVILAKLSCYKLLLFLVNINKT